jgi:hypothetical protein
VTAADIYVLVEAKCSDAEILAYAAMTATCAQWLAIKNARRWLNVVRDDQIRRAL